MGDARKSRDVDGGWAWVSLTAAMFIMATMAGNETSFGLFQVELFESFPESHGFVALIFSIAFGGRYLLAPVSGLFTDLWTSRFPVVLGAAILCVGMVIASFQYHLGGIFVFYGMGCGTGHGLIFNATMTMVSDCFNKYRTLAFGAILAATGVGTIVTPYLVGWLIDQYGWRLALASFACLSAQSCVLGALFYPRDPSLSPTCCCPKSHQLGKDGRCEPEMGALDWATKEDRPRESDDEETELLPHPQTTRRRILALLRQKFLWLMCFNQMMVTAGYATGYNFFPAYADSLGVPSEDVPALYTVYGVMVILSRLVGGVVFNVFPNHLLVAFCCVQLGMALSFGLLPFYGVSTQTLFVERCITGVTFGPSLLLVAPILVHYLGTKNLSLALGAVLLCSGIGAVSAPAIAGAMYDIYRSFRVCYYLSGSLIALGALSLLLIPFTSNTPSSQR